MNDLEDFEDWSHPTPVAMHLPRGRRRVNWWRLFGCVIFLASASITIWGVWEIVRAYRTIYQ